MQDVPLKIQTLNCGILSSKWTVLIFLSSVFLTPTFTYVLIWLGNGKDSGSLEESWNSSRKSHRGLSISRVSTRWKAERSYSGGRMGRSDSSSDTGFVDGIRASSPVSPRKETALSQREVNKVLGKEKGPETQSKIRILEPRE